MADHKTAFDARLRQALDITTPDLTPAPATWSDLKSRMRKRGSLGHLLSRNGFLPAAVFVLFAMTDSSNGPVSSASSNLALVGVDSSNALDSIAMRAQLGLGIEDSLLYRVNADSLR
jgi:hypothetical protein